MLLVKVLLIMLLHGRGAVGHVAADRIFHGRGAVGNCTDGNTVFRCDSDKNSLVIIYMF